LKGIGLIVVGCIAPIWALVSWSSYIDGAYAGSGPIRSGAVNTPSAGGGFSERQ
jgi:hypothetical protein